MQKRTKIALVVLIGLLLILLGVWIFVQPILQERAAQQPPELSGGLPYMAQGDGGKNGAGTSATTTATSTPAATATPIIDPLQELQNQAKALAERIGSGSSQSGFLGYQDAVAIVTAGERKTLLAEQADLIQQHPATSTLFTLTTRAVASKVTEGKIGDAKIVVQVQAIQTENASLPGVNARPSAKLAEITFVKQTSGEYAADAIVWSLITL